MISAKNTETVQTHWTTIPYYVWKTMETCTFKGNHWSWKWNPLERRFLNDHFQVPCELAGSKTWFHFSFMSHTLCCAGNFCSTSAFFSKSRRVCNGESLGIRTQIHGGEVQPGLPPGMSLGGLVHWWCFLNLKNGPRSWWLSPPCDC